MNLVSSSLVPTQALRLAQRIPWPKDVPCPTIVHVVLQDNGDWAVLFDRATTPVLGRGISESPERAFLGASMVWIDMHQRASKKCPELAAATKALNEVRRLTQS